MDMQKKKDKLSIQIDDEVREAFEWLKDNDYNVSGLVKRMLKDKVAELKMNKGGANG